ncbi:hypothetical protein HGI15_22395, partial [Modestobacter lapidis]|nr:hypothetical protein [Modestobacter lapidis]
SKSKGGSQGAGKVFALFSPDREASDTVIEGMFCIYNSWVRVLFDTGSTHSFISTSCALRLGLQFEPLGYILSVASPMGTDAQTSKICRSCVIRIDDHELEVDLISLNMSTYDVILGMDWLSQYRARIDCYKKHVTIYSAHGLSLRFEGEKSRFQSLPYSRKISRHAQIEGLMNSLASSELEEEFEHPLDCIPIVQEFLDVFPEELP